MQTYHLKDGEVLLQLTEKEVCFLALLVGNVNGNGNKELNSTHIGLWNEFTHHKYALRHPIYKALREQLDKADIRFKP